MFLKYDVKSSIDLMFIFSKNNSDNFLYINILKVFFEVSIFNISSFPYLLLCSDKFYLPIKFAKML